MDNDFIGRVILPVGSDSPDYAKGTKSGRIDMSCKRLSKIFLGKMKNILNFEPPSDPAGTTDSCNFLVFGT